MKIFITGICGFLGFNIAKYLRESFRDLKIFGIDNLSRRGVEYNIKALKEIGVDFYHGDIRLWSDFENIPRADWVIDCAANPSVVAGINSPVRQLIENNLWGSLNVLEYCRINSCGLILISTSRVYSVNSLNSLKLIIKGDRFQPLKQNVKGFSQKGISEEFDTSPPLSLYGATKLSSEIMAREYSNSFNFPLIINRCGVIAGPGQFGKIDQGIYSFWVYSFMLRKKLSYIGFEGRQVRDVVSALDVGKIILKQIKGYSFSKRGIYNIGGGLKANMSLREINTFCEDFFKIRYKPAIIKEKRHNDIPYYVSDYSLAKKIWDWEPAFSAIEILEQISKWALENRELVAYFLES